MSEQQQLQEPVSTHLDMRDVGRIFTDAREQAGLTLDEAAARLCLRPQQVDAMERGAVDELPGQTFVRGFIRGYAKLLHLDAGPLVEAHRRHAPADSAGRISLQCEHIPIVEPTRRSWTLYLRVAAVIGMALGAWMVYMDYFAERPATTPAADVVSQGGVEHEPPPQEEPPVEAAVQPLMTDMAELAAAPPAPVQPPQPEATQPLPVLPPAAAPAATAQPPVAAPAATTTLKLTFAESSWVRVRDRDGRDLLNKTAAAGAVEQVAGTPPLRLEIGNTNGVQVSYRDQAVDLAPHTRANVARFTLE